MKVSCLYEQEAEGDAETVDEDVAGGLAQTLVELAAFVDAAARAPAGLTVGNLVGSQVLVLTALGCTGLGS